MSHNIRSKTYMQVAQRKGNRRMQTVQMVLAVLVLIALVATSQLAGRVNNADSLVLEQSTPAQVQPSTFDDRY